jgi:hypothetical protein
MSIAGHNTSGASGGGDHPVVHSASVSASVSASGFDPEAPMGPNPQHARPVPVLAGSPTGAPFRSCSAADTRMPPLAAPPAPAAS